MTIGYIGLGTMGGALAERLLLTHPLLVHDRSEAAGARLAALGATPVDIAELAARSETIMLCLPTSDHVREVLFGEQALADLANPGTVIVDQTSGDPSATREIAAALAARDIHLIDAPVSGGPMRAAAGTIAIMVGAPRERFDALKALFESISPNVFHVGDIGAGHTIKLVNNLISGAQRLLTLEGVALAARNGLEPQVAVRVLAAGGARNAYLDTSLPHVMNGNLDLGFTLALAHKDVRLACQLGSESGLPMFFGNLTRDYLQLCINENGGEARVDTAALYVDRIAGTSIVSPPAADSEEQN
nr:NAD(P)-dependent oxidoreductase [Nocardia coffeae]